MHYVYVIQSETDGQLYVGCTQNLRQRLETHNSAKVPSAKGRAPFRLIYYEASLNKRDAFHREKYLKTSYGKRFIKSRCKHYFTG